MEYVFAAINVRGPTCLVVEFAFDYLDVLSLLWDQVVEVFVVGLVFDVIDACADLEVVLEEEFDNVGAKISAGSGDEYIVLFVEVGCEVF